MTLGETLRQERLRQQKSLDEIATSLRIMRRYLEAIENNEVQSVAGGVFYYKAFVRQYAVALGLESKGLESNVDSLISALEPPKLPGLDTKVPVRDRDADPIVSETNRELMAERRFGFAGVMLVAVVVACTAFYGWWTRNQWQFPWEKTATAAQTQAAAQPPAVETKPAEQPAAQPVQTTPQPDPVTTTPVETAPAGAMAVPASTPSGATVMNVEQTGDLKRVVLNVSATERTWLSITSDGRTVFSGVLEPSQTKTLEGKEMTRIRVGNAGGVEVQWNGKPIGPLGPRGQVRVASFTKDNYEILQPKKEY